MVEVRGAPKSTASWHKIYKTQRDAANEIDGGSEQKLIAKARERMACLRQATAADASGETFELLVTCAAIVLRR